MTREEQTISNLKKLKSFHNGSYGADIDRAIEALEQHKDAISRQAVLEYIEGSDAELGHSSENELVCQDIKGFPPVTPQSRTGHWIDLLFSFECSECGIIRAKETSGKYNFCPNCGAKMVEPQTENEDKK